MDDQLKMMKEEKETQEELEGGKEEEGDELMIRGR